MKQQENEVKQIKNACAEYCGAVSYYLEIARELTENQDEHYLQYEITNPEAKEKALKNYPRIGRINHAILDYIKEAQKTISELNEIVDYIDVPKEPNNTEKAHQKE